MDKDLDKRLNKLERDSHPPVNWEGRIDKMENTWKELYHKLVMDFTEVKKEVELLRTILHTYLPIVKKDDNGMEGTT